MALGIGKGNIGAASARRLGDIQSSSARRIGEINAAGVSGQGQALAQGISNIPAALSQGLQLEGQFQKRSFNEAFTAGSDEAKQEHLAKVTEQIKVMIPRVAEELDSVIADKTKDISTKIRAINKMIPNSVNRENVLTVSDSEFNSIVSEAQSKSGVDPLYVGQLLKQKKNLQASYMKSIGPILKQMSPIMAAMIRKTGDTSILSDLALSISGGGDFQSIMAGALVKSAGDFADSPGELANVLDGTEVETPLTDIEKANISDTAELKEVEKLKGKLFQPATEGQKNNPLVKGNPSVYSSSGGGMVKLREIPEKTFERLTNVVDTRKQLYEFRDDLVRKGVNPTLFSGADIPFGVGDALIKVFQTPEFQGMRARGTKLVQAYVKALSGLQATDPEFKRSKSVYPTLEEKNLETFLSKAFALDGTLESEFDTIVQVLDDNAFFTEGFKTSRGRLNNEIDAGDDATEAELYPETSDNVKQVGRFRVREVK